MENIAFFIPIYNEIKSKEIILQNIDILINVFPKSRVYFSDNCSVDGTWEFLQTIKEAKYASIHITRKSENIGFARNLLSVNDIAEDDECYIMICGGNDILLEDGLRNLKETIQKNRPCLVMANWRYHTECDGKIKIISTHDIKTSFKTESLDSFFANGGNIPVGICQYTAKKKIFKKMYKWEKLISPQIGVFIDAFPCKFVAIGNPPTHSVKHIEEGGWRKDSESIFNTHVIVVKEILAILKYAFIKCKISKCIYIAVCTRYTSALPNLLYDMYLGSWGVWKCGRQTHWRHPVRLFKVLKVGCNSSINVFISMFILLVLRKSNYSKRVIKYYTNKILHRC